MKSLARTASGPLKNTAQLRVAVLGATGYAGVELLRLLVQHPRVQLSVLTSQQYTGKNICEIYPSLAGRCDMVLEEINLETILPRCDLVFTALPHETSMDLVPALFKAGRRVIDLSADFRLHDPKVYAKWYRPHKAPHLLSRAIYGLSELNRKRIVRAGLVANPGCYPTGALLGAVPLVAAKLVRGPVLVDSKSGVTGAGRAGSVELSYSEVNENFKAYQVGTHRHAPEIEQELSWIAKKTVPVIFVPHLVPMNRGILSTLYFELVKPLEEERITEVYRNYYRGEPFVRLLPPGCFPETKDVRGSNDCAIGLRIEPRLKRLVVITAIDNLVKGAAGQAVQNMNLMCGFPETEALQGSALVP